MRRVRGESEFLKGKVSEYQKYFVKWRIAVRNSTVPHIHSSFSIFASVSTS